MSPSDFIAAYSAALSSQDWEQVAPLMHPEAFISFSTGGEYRGLGAIGAAYRHNFSVIKNEFYTISDIKWIEATAEKAVYTFAYYWHGQIDGREASGGGTGTAVIGLYDGRWLLTEERLVRV